MDLCQRFSWNSPEEEDLEKDFKNITSMRIVEQIQTITKININIVDTHGSQEKNYCSYLKAIWEYSKKLTETNNQYFHKKLLGSIGFRRNTVERR